MVTATANCKGCADGHAGGARSEVPPRGDRFLPGQSRVRISWQAVEQRLPPVIERGPRACNQAPTVSDTPSASVPVNVSAKVHRLWDSKVHHPWSLFRDRLRVGPQPSPFLDHSGCFNENGIADEGVSMTITRQMGLPWLS